jgi:hypothetical protein
MSDQLTDCAEDEIFHLSEAPEYLKGADISLDPYCDESNDPAVGRFFLTL